MAISVQTKPQTYILEDDREQSSEWQTVWTIQPQTLAAQNRIAAKYSTIKEMRGGARKEKVDPDKLQDASLFSFLEVVVKVERYFIREDEGKRPEVMGLFGLNGESPVLTTPHGDSVYRVDASDRNQLKYIAEHMDTSSITELEEVSGRQSRLREGEKKS